ncbi:hypothetical protein HMPREF0970_01393 [Schaalia odontolytica F0309]|uniref:Uncharacterized protein n=1 Tax=Schaalia odontolytica F0309 TaxID=649742 RepID=D4TZL2_9ACTO|nr:hypothetical protein HMPREF0970_01393 [Schaalia odontolytica F0309]
MPGAGFAGFALPFPGFAGAEVPGAGAEVFEESSESDPDIAQMTTPTMIAMTTTAAMMPMMSGVLDLPPCWGAP